MNNGNKPAFAYVVPSGIGTKNGPVESGVVPGLTKREMIAMAAMQGLLSNPGLGEKYDHVEVRGMAIDHADELLKQLESKLVMSATQKQTAEEIKVGSFVKCLFGNSGNKFWHDMLTPFVQVQGISRAKDEEPNQLKFYNSEQWFYANDFEVVSGEDIRKQVSELKAREASLVEALKFCVEQMSDNVPSSNSNAYRDYVTIRESAKSILKS